jgi:tetratricopeptide (TPR) repeat protein
MRGSVHLQRAQTALDLKQFEVARREAIAAASDEPNNPQPHLLLGRICLQLAQYRSAREFAEETVKLAPEWAGGYWLLGWGWLLDRGTDIPGNLTGPSRPRIKSARAAAQTALALQPDTETNYLLLGAIELEDGQFATALGHFESGLSINPSNAALLRWRGSALFELGRFEEAEQCCLASLQICPEDPSTHHLVARLHTKRRNFRAAIPHVRELMRLAADNEQGAELYWELMKTQHPLLRGAVWLNQRCSYIRQRAGWWMAGTLLVGVTLTIILNRLAGNREPSRIGLLLFAAIVTIPWWTELLPAITDALWLWLGRDKEQPLQSWVERFTTVEFAVGLGSLPAAGVLAAVSGSPIAFFWVWGGICVAVLHNLGMRLERGWARYGLFAAALAWMAGTVVVGLAPASPADPEKWRMLHMIGSGLVAAVAGYLFHRATKSR